MWERNPIFFYKDVLKPARVGLPKIGTGGNFHCQVLSSVLGHAADADVSRPIGKALSLPRGRGEMTPPMATYLPLDAAVTSCNAQAAQDWVAM